MEDINSRYVVVADGSFPIHEIPLEYIRKARKLICCDGSTGTLVQNGFIPDAIVGDMDSLSEDLAIRFADRIYQDDDQDTNDLTKAVKWCTQAGYRDLVIVGATGKREDHTIGNISLLAEYIKINEVLMVTDTGFFRPFVNGREISSFPGQQVSIFSIDTETEITSYGLRYPLKRSKIKNWWEATLNESLGNSFRLEFGIGRIIVYLKYKE
jgi:thiamine pyrophosphokinase